MTLKELSQLYWLRREIEQYREQLRGIALPGAAVSDGMPKSQSAESRTERAASESERLEGLIASGLAKCEAEHLKLEEYIASIPDSLTRQIFRLRFVYGLSWRRLAFRIGGGNTEDSVKKTVYRYLRKSR